jgi:2-polyprenyl-6-hydroxyphenyl methylase/3-demethylubiquinone-9 3-methyltransferase
VALLRAESRLARAVDRGPSAEGFEKPCDVLDVGCGAGFLANRLACAGHRVIGLDTSGDSLAVARRHDATQRVRWHRGDALALPFGRECFDTVCLMDVLEHVEEPSRVVAESASVLVPGGLLFFNTYNRNWLSWLVAIKGVEWFVRNTPRDMHVLRLFIRPDELSAMCEAADLGRGRADRVASARRPRDAAHAGDRDRARGFRFHVHVDDRARVCGHRAQAKDG